VFGGLAGDEALQEDPFDVTAELPQPSTIHGHLADRGPGPRWVTLIRCRQTHRSHTAGGATNGEPSESWTFSEVLRGHEQVDHEASVVAIRVRLANLLEWSGRDRPSLDRSADGVTARVDSLDLGTGQVAGAAIALTLGHSASLSGYEVTLRSEAMFEVTPDSPVSLRAAMSDFALPLRSLLSFLTLGHVDIRSLGVKLESHQANGPGTWFDYATRLHRPLEEPDLPLPHEMLATWPQLEEMTVHDLVGNWYALHGKLEKTIHYLLIPHHATYLYSDDHLMTAFIAAEAYHRARFDGSVLDPHEYQARVDAIVAAAPEELRVWAHDQLKNRNQKGQKKRLEDLAERAGQTGSSVRDACPGFIVLAVKSRNKVAHPSSSRRDRGEIYLGVSYGLRWILRHCLLVDLGLSEDRVGELISRNERFHVECELIERLTRS